MCLNYILKKNIDKFQRSKNSLSIKKSNEIITHTLLYFSL